MLNFSITYATDWYHPQATRWNDSIKENIKFIYFDLLLTPQKQRYKWIDNEWVQAKSQTDHDRQSSDKQQQHQVLLLQNNSCYVCTYRSYRISVLIHYPIALASWDSMRAFISPESYISYY